MRESKNACNDSMIIAGVSMFQIYYEKPAELVSLSNTIQKVYYPEKKPTILIFKTKKDATELRPTCLE